MSRINFEKFNKAFSRVDEKKLKSLDDVFLQKLDDVAEQLSNKGVKFPLCFIEDLYNHSKLNTFLLESNFKFYKSEPLLDLSNNNEISDEALVCYYKFACALGCFSHKTLEPLSEIFLGAKAVSTLAKIIKSKMLKNDDFIQLFQYFTYDVKPDNDFVKFLSAPGKDKSLPNFDLLYSMNIIFPEIFFFVMKNFNKIKNSRLVSDENGDPQKLSWSDAILRFYRIFNFETLKNYSEEELTLFQLGLNIDDVEMATQTFEMAKILNVPEHILGKPLKEKTILEEIEEIKMQTKDLLGEGKKLIEKTYKKQFTFEMLSKRDLLNAVIGIYCSCCATISSESYGNDLVYDTIMKEYVQNLVAKDINGQIIGKGTLYINKKLGYGVFNDFEINENYKFHEEKLDRNGYYNVSPDSKEENEREQIFQALLRGMDAFIEEYDKQNPKRPIMQINVGMGCNKLKAQCERFKAATEKEMLEVPMEYSFEDAAKGQWILYKRGGKKSKSNMPSFEIYEEV